MTDKYESLRDAVNDFESGDLNGRDLIVLANPETIRAQLADYDRMRDAAHQMHALYPNVWDRADGCLVVFPENVERFDAAFEGLRAAPVAQEPVVMKEICPECGHQFACFHNPYINQLRAAPVAAQAQPTGYEEAGSFIWDGDEWRMAAAKYGEDPDVVTLYKRVNAQDEPQQSGNSGELPTAQDREGAAALRAILMESPEAVSYPNESWTDAYAEWRTVAISAARAAKGE